jgi:RNA-directed DNA polymerase
MKDRAMQALYLLALSPVAEATADKNSYGFRPGRSTADAIAQSFLVLSRKDSATWVLEGDIRGCFDNINHEWMLSHIPTDKTVLRKWLNAGFVENRILFPTRAGTPQGGIISPTLANLTLDGLERLLRKEFSPKQSPAPKVNLIRYADDFIITGKTKELLEKEVKPLVEHFLRDRGLQLSPEKTCVTHIETGFDFLGQYVRKFGGKLLIQPSKKNTHAFLDKMRHVIRRSRGLSQTDLIRQLNPLIRGWAYYHRHVAAKRTYKKVEWALWHSLLRWGKHRHSNKSSRWVIQKYWHSPGGKNVFAADTQKQTPDGKPIWSKLVKPTDISIRRHLKIRGDANPFDPSWNAYFEDRAFFKWFGIHRREAGLQPSTKPAPL